MKKETVIKIVSLYLYALTHTNPPKDMEEVVVFLKTLGISVNCAKAIDLAIKWYKTF